MASSAADYRALPQLGDGPHQPNARPRADSRVTDASTHTPVLRRSQIETYTRTTAHESLVSSCEFALGYEAIALAYLTGCLIFIKDWNASCGFNIKHNTLQFLQAVLWPVLLFRFIGYLKYKNSSYVSMRDYLFFVDTYRSVAFGCWTIYQMYQIVNMTAQCD